MTAYAEYLLSRPKKPALTSSAAAKPSRHYQPPATWDEKCLSDLSKSVSVACDRFFRRRGM